MTILQRTQGMLNPVQFKITGPSGVAASDVKGSLVDEDGEFPFDELVPLSTCNRTEFYSVAADRDMMARNGFERLTDGLVETRGVERAAINTRDHIEHPSGSLVNKLLHEPTQRLRASPRKYEVAEVAGLTRELFGLQSDRRSTRRRAPSARLPAK